MLASPSLQEQGLIFVIIQKSFWKTGKLQMRCQKSGLKVGNFGGNLMLTRFCDFRNEDLQLGRYYVCLAITLANIVHLKDKDLLSPGLVPG